MPPTKTLPAGTTLYHGTCASLPFEIPKGPAWFAFTLSAALYWAGPAWKKARQPVAKQYQTQIDLHLLDTHSLLDWQALAVHLGVEEHSYVMAWAVVAKNYPGWVGTTEVLLTDPTNAVSFTGVEWGKTETKS